MAAAKAQSQERAVNAALNAVLPRRFEGLMATNSVLISLARRLQAQRLDRHRIQRGLTVLFRDYAEATRVIPHRPSDIVTFESGADVAEPARTVFGVGLAINAKLVAGEWHIPVFSPFSGLADLDRHAVRIPVVESIAENIEAV